MRLVVLLVTALVASCGVRGKRWDTTALVRELGLDGAAEALRVRIADEPDDVGARRALAKLEGERGRPGAVIEQLEIVAAIGGPFGSRLDDGERATLAGLYLARARQRAQAMSPGALGDLDHARSLGATDDAGLREEATYALALAELKDTDPERRAAGAKRMGLDQLGGDELGAAGLRLWQQGARRAAHDLLVQWNGAGTDPAMLDAWLAALSWWGGARDRPDLATLRRAVEAGASPCHFAEAYGDQGCEGDVPGVLERARRRGWRTSDPDEATLWVAITARAWMQGGAASWLDELDQRVDLAGLAVVDGKDARVPAWARAPLLRAQGRLDEARVALERARASSDGLSDDAKRVVAIEVALAGGSRGDVEALDDNVASTMEGLRAPPGAEPALVLGALFAPVEERDAFIELARAYLDDASSADRVAADVVARDVDRARSGAAVAELFQVLGDPARARAWWERAVEASPLDPELRAGLVRGLAAAGDGAAARVAVVTAAAKSGDAGRAMLDGARAMADAGLTVDALVPAKDAVELTAPGEQQEILQLLVELEARMDRPKQVQSLGAALAAQHAPRDATTLRALAMAGDPDALAKAVAADPADAALAILVAANEPKETAAARLAYAATWNPLDLPVRLALVARTDGDARSVTLGEIAGIAVVRDRAGGARAFLSASRAGASSR